MNMKCSNMILLAGMCVSCAIAKPSPSDIPHDLVCTNRFFAVPESVDMSNVDQARMLVKANPNRFEAHLMLASALLANKRIEDCIREFKVVDELSSRVKDQAVLAGLQYEDIYAFALFVAAERRLKEDVNDLYTLRMFRQVIGMDHSKLEEKGLLPRCYMYIATLYVTRGAYDSAIRSAMAGRVIAEEKEDTESIMLLDAIIKRATELKDKGRFQQSTLSSEDAPSAAPAER
jgi:hypothetical protein